MEIKWEDSEAPVNKHTHTLYGKVTSLICCLIRGYYIKSKLKISKIKQRPKIDSRGKGGWGRLFYWFLVYLLSIGVSGITIQHNGKLHCQCLKQHVYEPMACQNIYVYIKNAWEV